MKLCIEEKNFCPNINSWVLTLAENLKLHTSIDILYKSLNKAYFMIKSLKEVTSHQAVRILYHAYFQSGLKYGIIFWLTDSYSKKVYCHQKKEVIHLIFGIKGHAPSRNSSKACKI